GFIGRKQAKLERDLASIPQTGGALSSDHIPHIAAYIRAEAGGRWTDRDWLTRHNLDRVERWEQDADRILTRIDSAEVRSVIEPLVQAGYYYATIAAVEDAGVQPVYSIKVDSDDHAFLTNGLVSHNTEARMSPIAAEIVADIDKDTVDFKENYTAEKQEPVWMPARIPNLLINGASGIAV